MRILYLLLLSITSSISMRFINPFNKIFQPKISFPTGFYGIIGPNVNISSVKTLFDLFTGDGIIQGVFIESDNITFVKHIVRTNKRIYESNRGKFIKHPWLLPFFIMFHKMGFIPNVLDLANTAFLSVKNKTYALFERDYPYEMKFENNQIETHTKIHIPGLDSFSGHSKYDGYIHTIDYDVIFKKVRYMILDSIFREHNRSDIRMKYIPLVHDFGLLKNGIILMDSPFVWDFSKRVPVILDKSKPTYFHVLQNRINTYVLNSSIYLFHYADIREHINGTIDIYAPYYDDVNFASLNIQGKYRKIVIHSDNPNIFIYKNEELENMNLDFPIKWKKYIILREIKDNSISGFVVCQELKIIKRVYLPKNRFFCGEPAVFEKEGSPFLIGLSYDENQMGYICVLNIFTNEYIERPLNTTVTIGFHSITFGF